MQYYCKSYTNIRISKWRPVFFSITHTYKHMYIWGRREKKTSHILNTHLYGAASDNVSHIWLTSHRFFYVISYSHRPDGCTPKTCRWNILLNLVNISLLRRDLFVLISCFFGIMLFWVEFLTHNSINFLILNKFISTSLCNYGFTRL